MLRCGSTESFILRPSSLILRTVPQSIDRFFPLRSTSLRFWLSLSIFPLSIRSRTLLPALNEAVLLTKVIQFTSPTMTSILSAMLVLLAGLLISFCLKLYKQRRLMKGLVSTFPPSDASSSPPRRQASLSPPSQPMPPHHTLLGHLPVFAKIVRSLPPDIHPHCYPHFIRQAYDLGPIFYLHTWPLGDPMLIIAGEPDAAHEVTVAHSLPKHHSLRTYLAPVGGQKNLVSMDGPEWKAWRSIFNPGFAPANLMGLVPSIVEEVEVFARGLGEWADRGEVVILEEVATRVTVDVIGKVVLDKKVGAIFPSYSNCLCGVVGRCVLSRR